MTARKPLRQTSENDMPDDLEPHADGETTEGVPWQIIYASFLGVMLSACGIYGGMYLIRGRTGWVSLSGGVLTLAVSAAVGAAFVMLIAGFRPALAVCRVFVLLCVAGAVTALGWTVRMARQTASADLPGATAWRLTLEVLLAPGVLASLTGLGLCVVMLWFLFGRTGTRFFSAR
jgi:hypothetical protein